MKRLLREPLVQFLALGFILYVLIETNSPQVLIEKNPLKIIVNEENLKEYLQFQRKSFDPEASQNLLQSMSSLELQRLTDDYVRDEALFREALVLGLNENDEIIRRRLIQKMEYVAQGFYQQLAEIDQETLKQYFEANINDYKVAAAVTFTHVFISGTERVDQIRAVELLEKLNKASIPFEDAGQYGERSLYNQNYVERTPDYISSHFGVHFQKSIFSLQANKGAEWQGPIRSEHGYHLVNIRNNLAERFPDLVEVAPIVLADAQRMQQQAKRSEAIKKLVEKYQVSNTLNDY